MRTEEIWKDIPGYEGKYQVSDWGNVRSLDRIGYRHKDGKAFKVTLKGRVLRPGPTKSGHLYVMLGRKTHGIPVHQLVAKTFIGPRPKGSDVRHLNGNPADNRLENLAYGSRTENILDVYKDGGRWRKLNLEEVKQIKARIAAGDMQAQIARDFGISACTVGNIKFKRIYWLVQ